VRRRLMNDVGCRESRCSVSSSGSPTSAAINRDILYNVLREFFSPLPLPLSLSLSLFLSPFVDIILHAKREIASAIKRSLQGCCISPLTRETRRAEAYGEIVRNANYRQLR